MILGARLSCVLITIAAASAHIGAGDDIVLSNSFVTLTFSASGQFLTTNFTLNDDSSGQPQPPTQWSGLDATFSLDSSSAATQCKPASPASVVHNATVVMVDYMCWVGGSADTPSKMVPAVKIYELIGKEWKFFTQRIRLQPSNTDLSTVNVVLMNGLSASPNLIDDSDVVNNQFYQNYHHAAFLRFWSRTDPPQPNYGLFMGFQNPLSSLMINDHGTGVVNGTYAPLIAVMDAYGYIFETDRLVIGSYLIPPTDSPAFLSQWIAPFNGGTFKLLFAVERDAFIECIEQFLIDPPSRRQRSVRTSVSWDSNDYQIDIATPAGWTEYQRLIDRAATLGIDGMVVGPQNSAVSDRFHNADAWGWEFCLFLTLGQQIRKNQWLPVGSDSSGKINSTLPPTVQQLLDYAAARKVKLLAYVYPPVPYSQNSEWLFRGGDGYEYATLANTDFQDWFSKLIIHFMNQTGIGGYAFDYNSFVDPSHSLYAQYKGWMRILYNLRIAFPDVIIDHRQSAHAYGGWYWTIAGSYAEPIQYDENPESYPLIPPILPSLKADHICADDLRKKNWSYRNWMFCPSVRVPGFIGHQTERLAANGSVPFSNYLVRDFDYLGFEYSLLSNIATAGLNLVHTMTPAKDVEEFQKITPTDKFAFWLRWLEWTDRHNEALWNARSLSWNGTINGNPQLIDGMTCLYNNRSDGFVFLFNPSVAQQAIVITVDEFIRLRPPNTSAAGGWLIRTLYPEPAKVLDVNVAYGSEMQIRIDGSSATVLEFTYHDSVSSPLPTPLLIGVAGSVKWQSDQITLALSWVMGEAGTEHAARVYYGPAVSPPRAVTVNGVSLPFEIDGDDYTAVLSNPVAFNGTYFPRSARIGPAPSPDFTGGTFLIPSFNLPTAVLNQIVNRSIEYPIDWSADDYSRTWLVVDRLLLYIVINGQEVDDSISVQVTLPAIGVWLPVQRSYLTVHPSDKFLGYYVDLSAAIEQYYLQFGDNEAGYEVAVMIGDGPGVLTASQFVGLFIDNVEPVIVPASP